MSSHSSPHPGFMSAGSTLSVFHSSSFGELRRSNGVGFLHRLLSGINVAERVQTGSDSPYSFAFSSRYSTLSEKVYTQA